MLGKTLSGRKLDPDAFTTPPTSYQLAILGALQHRALYQGTVGAGLKDARRARGRAAKAARRRCRR